MMKYFYALLFTLIFSVAAFAQTDFRPGYIQKTDGSRTEGLLDYRSEARNALGVTFKENESSSAVVYKPGELQGYGFNGSKRYESIVFTGADSREQTYFMEVLAKGAASLYFIKEEQGKERYFLKKEAAPVQELVQEERMVEKGGKTYKAKIKQFVGTLTVAMLDCPEAKQSIDKAELEQSDLVKVFAKYNACVAPGQEEAFQKDTERNISIEKGIIAGVTMVNPGFTTSERSAYVYLTNTDFSSLPALTGGVFFNLNMRKVNEKLSLHTGLLYHQYRIEGSYKDQQSANNYHDYDGYLKASYVRLPILLRYTYPKGKVRPYLNAGVHYSFLLKADSEVTKNSSYYGTTYTRTSPVMEDYRGSDEGVLGGAGVSVPFGAKSKLNIEARYERSKGISPYINLRSGYSAVSLLVGITL